MLRTSSDNPLHLAGHLLGTGLLFEPLEPLELREHVRVIARDLAARHRAG